MADRRFSVPTLSLLSALEQDPAVWRHGYELATETGLRSEPASADRTSTRRGATRER
ncbi:MAG: hypothetical protein ACLP0J_08740 [Solirubrobacteraceae bacterium]